jgi:glucokinase
MAEPFQMPCHCGNLGCWETYANQYSIIRRVENRLQNSQSRGGVLSTLMDEQHAPLSLAIIKQAAEAGDQDALDSLAEAGTAMGTGFAGLVNIFNPEKIILGGPVSLAGDYLMPSIRASVKKHAMHEIVQQTEINLSAFGPDASLIGAAAVVVDDILTNPTHVEKEVMPETTLDPIAL